MSSFVEAFKAFVTLGKLALSEGADETPTTPETPDARRAAADPRPEACDRTKGCGLPKGHPHEEPCVVVEID